MAWNYIGVDLSREHIDICDPRRGEARCANTPATIKKFIASLGDTDFLVFEATSGCDRPLMDEGERAGIAFTRLNPSHSWHFSRSLNLAKTDRVDARMLARLGAERQPEPDAPRDRARTELADLARRRDQLIRMQTQESNRLSECTHPVARRDITASLKTLATRLKRIGEAIDAHLNAHTQLHRHAELLRTIPGVGERTAVELLAHLPELGQCDRRAVASLGGLAPRARDSGKYRGKRFLGDGRRHIRKALYMAALSALRHPHLFGGQVTRMRENGKPGKVIVIAIARKMLVTANAILRSETPFKEVNCVS